MSTTYIVSKAVFNGGAATLTLDRVTGLWQGYTVYVSGSQPLGDLPYLLATVDAETNTVQVPSFYGASTFPSVNWWLTLPVSWITANDVSTFFGVAPAEEVDIDWLDTCVKAANIWCFERRQDAGYNDNPNSVPNDRVKLGTINKAAESYRSRGSIDGYSSFQQFEPTAPIASNMDILRMLGLNKPGIG